MTLQVDARGVQRVSLPAPIAGHEDALALYRVILPEILRFSTAVRELAYQPAPIADNEAPEAVERVR